MTTVQSNKTVLFIIAATIFVSLGISGGLLNIAWTYMQTDFAVPFSAIGIILLSATVGGLIAAFGSGFFIRKFGIGRLTFASLILVMLGFFAIGLAPTWILLISIVFITYTGRASLDAGMNNFFSNHYGATAMNWLHASWGLGLTIAPAIITTILLTFNLSWRMGYILIALIFLPLALIVLLTLSQWNNLGLNEKNDKQKNDFIAASMSETLRQPVVWWSVLLFFIYGGLEIGTGQLINTLFVDGRGISQEVSSLWISLYWGSFTVGRILIGFLALRLNEKLILNGSTTLAVIGAALLIVQNGEIFSVLGLVLIGFGLAAIFPILILQTPPRVGERHSANSIGFQVGITGLGGAILPGIFASSTELFGLEAISYCILLNAILFFVLYQWLALHYVVPISNRRALFPG